MAQLVVLLARLVERRDGLRELVAAVADGREAQRAAAAAHERTGRRTGRNGRALLHWGLMSEDE